MEKYINYNEGFLYQLANKIHTDKGRYFEPNMEDNNYSISTDMGSKTTVMLSKYQYDDFATLKRKKINEEIELAKRFDKDDKKDYLHKYNYSIEPYYNYNFDKCNIVFVGQTLSDKKYNPQEYSFLEKYNVKNLKQFDAQLFYIFLGLDKLSNDGEMVINIPSTYLFRNDTLSYCLRKYLIDNKLIKGVALIKGSCGLSEYEVIITLSKKQNDSISFVDAKNNDFIEFYAPTASFGEKESNSFKTDFDSMSTNVFSLIDFKKNVTGVVEVVPYEQIINNDYSLVVGDYVKSTKKRTHRSLYEIAQDIDFLLEELDDNCRYWAEI